VTDQVLLLSFPSSTVEVTEELKPSLAADVWEDLHKKLSGLLESLEPLPKTLQAVEDACREVRGVVTKAHEAPLKWDEVAELEWAGAVAHEGGCMLDHEPNAETIAAIEASRRGEVFTSNSVEELFRDLNADN
jgi:hypothetical protein